MPEIVHVEDQIDPTWKAEGLKRRGELRERGLRDTRVYYGDEPKVTKRQRSFPLPGELFAETRSHLGSLESYLDYLRNVNDIPHGALIEKESDYERGSHAVMFTWWIVDGPITN